MDEGGWDVNVAGRRPSLAELWRFRELAGFFAWRDLKVRYQQAILGVAWAVLQPLIAVLLFTFVFRRLVDVPSEGVPYPLFALAGYVLWSYTAAASNLSRMSLVGNAALLTRVYFPRLVLPTAALVPPLVDLAVGTVLLIGFALASDALVGARLLLAPVFVVGAAVVAFGVGTFAGSLSVRYRDVQQIFGFALQLWLLASPVLYPTSLVEERWHLIYRLNPMAGLIDGWRWSTVGGPAPDGTALASLAAMVVVLTVGLLTFRHHERSFADVV